MDGRVPASLGLSVPDQVQPFLLHAAEQEAQQAPDVLISMCLLARLTQHSHQDWVM